MPVISLDSADALLFDLGGVVIEVEFDRAFARWAAYSINASTPSKRNSPLIISTNSMNVGRWVPPSISLPYARPWASTSPIPSL
jgi:hypothetical protein